MAVETKYALKLKSSQKLLTYHTDHNGGDDFSSEFSYYLDSDSEQTWYTDSATLAEYVRHFSTEYYNSSIETPTHSFSADELEVVKVVITTEVTPVTISIPTYEEMLVKKIVTLTRDYEKAQFTSLLEDYLKDKTILSQKDLNKKYKVNVWDLNI